MSPQRTMARDNEAQFRFLAENSVDIICRADVDLVMHYASPSTVRALGWTPEEMLGRRPEDFVVAEDLPILRAAVDRAFDPNAETDTATVRMRKKDGSLAWMEMNARVIRDEVSGEPCEFVAVMRNITERKMIEERLFALAHTDSLTGLWNRRAFDEALEREWARAVRNGSGISLLMLDIDHFKEFNDRHGHLVGDDCLRSVGGAVNSAVRATDVVARYGGEEIAVILPETSLEDAVGLAERIRCSIEAGGIVTASIGVATADAGSAGMPETLVRAADRAMYRAKTGGRNRVATA
ncbi:MAG TPA: sensor domain-containing diguanylate cyclase [Bryobacteraceae bacterium]|nr:sensor domain-containing diguanylate cyclase [Bryobacteraceae bacterium]